MGRLLRLLLMFGPMIYRQVQKFQRNKARQQPPEHPSEQRQIPQEPAEKQVSDKDFV